MKIIGSTPYGIHGVGARASAKTSGPARTAGALVAGVPSRAGSAVIGIGEAAFAVALWSPIGFKEKHPIWGTLFGVGAAFNLIDALVP